MPDPTVSQGHVDQLLTNISVAYLQDAGGYVAASAFPVVPVAHASDKYFTFPRDAFLRDEVGPRPIGGYPNVVGHSVSTDSYTCEEQALEARIDDRERANATPPYDPERVKTRLLTQQHLIHRDKIFVSSYMKTGVWTTDVTGVASAPSGSQTIYWDTSTSTPSKEIRNRKRAVKALTGFEPNVLILGSTVENALLQHPDLIDRVKYTGNALSLDDTQLAQYFGVDKVVVATSIQNTADQGQTGAYGFIVGAKNALLVYAAPEAGLEVPSAGYIFAWTGLLGQNAFTPAVVNRGRDDRASTDWFQVRTSYAMKVVSPDLGVYFSAVVQ